MQRSVQLVMSHLWRSGIRATVCMSVGGIFLFCFDNKTEIHRGQKELILKIAAYW